MEELTEGEKYLLKECEYYYGDPELVEFNNFRELFTEDDLMFFKTNELVAPDIIDVANILELFNEKVTAELAYELFVILEDNKVHKDGFVMTCIVNPNSFVNTMIKLLTKL